MITADQIVKIGRLIVHERMTVRQVSDATGCSKSNIHRLVTVRLKQIDLELYNRVTSMLKYHKAIRHLRGGEATRAVFSKGRDGN